MAKEFRTTRREASLTTILVTPKSRGNAATCMRCLRAYSVGDPSLDAQHKQIIGVINELLESLQHPNGHIDLRPILDRLLRYTAAHFKQEKK
jgi:hypothetical protein